MAAGITPPNRWTINPHFVTKSFQTTLRIYSALSGIKAFHLFRYRTQQILQRGSQNTQDGMQDMRTCFRGVDG